MYTKVLNELGPPSWNGSSAHGFMCYHVIAVIGTHSDELCHLLGVALYEPLWRTSMVETVVHGSYPWRSPRSDSDCEVGRPANARRRRHQGTVTRCRRWHSNSVHVSNLSEASATAPAHHATWPESTMLLAVPADLLRHRPDALVIRLESPYPVDTLPQLLSSQPAQQPISITVSFAGANFQDAKIKWNFNKHRTNNCIWLLGWKILRNLITSLPQTFNVWKIFSPAQTTIPSLQKPFIEFLLRPWPSLNQAAPWMLIMWI